MSAEHWRRELMRDVQRAVRSRRVIYLEGKTDPDVFATLLGCQVARDDLYDGVVVRGLCAGKGGSGGNTLELILQISAELGLTDYISIIRDADGMSHDDANASFCGGGPHYAWPTYCIENLLAQVEGGWPPRWGDAPCWGEALRDYTAYVALNVVHKDLQQSLRTLELATFTNPSANQPLLDVSEVQRRLESDRALIAGYNVASRFHQAVELFTSALDQGRLHDAHAMLNGKWLVNDLARRRANQSQEACRNDWCEAVRMAGGHPAVKAWWERIKAPRRASQRGEGR